MSKETRKIHRRKFLGQAACGAIGLTTFLSTWQSLQASAAAATLSAGPASDYKALVCILLGGGNDSYNMLVPYGTSEYAEYAEVRSNLAIPQNLLLDLNYTDVSGRSLGLHPAMPELAALFQSGNLAFVNNIGTLVEPVTKAQYLSQQGNFPLGLFSHEDQIKHWQTSVPNERSPIGWGGKIADLLHASVNDNLNLSMNISLSGTNVFQTGRDFIEYAISPIEGSQGINGYTESDNWNALRKQVIDNLIDHNYTDMFKKTYANTIRYAQNSHELFSGALAQFDVNTVFSENELSQALHMIARTIGIRESLGMTRQIFFVQFDGWDHHDEVLNKQVEMLGIVSRAMSEFYAATEELGLENEVMTFTISDFARTLTSNGNGTDHAWGGHQMVMGGAVNGGQTYGSYPDLYLGNDLDLYNGVIIPTTSTDSYIAELATWFGVAKTDLPIILPNIANFYNIFSTENPIGFAQI